MYVSTHLDEYMLIYQQEREKMKHGMEDRHPFCFVQLWQGWINRRPVYRKEQTVVAILNSQVTAQSYQMGKQVLKESIHREEKHHNSIIFSLLQTNINDTIIIPVIQTQAFNSFVFSLFLIPYLPLRIRHLGASLVVKNLGASQRLRICLAMKRRGFNPQSRN